MVEEWDAMNEVALATIQMSVKPVHLNMVALADTAKEAWDALKVMFQARDNARLLRLMDELSGLKKCDDENIIKFASRAKMIRTSWPCSEARWTTTISRCVSCRSSRLSTGCSGRSWKTRTSSWSCRT